MKNVIMDEKYILSAIKYTHTNVYRVTNHSVILHPVHTLSLSHEVNTHAHAHTHTHTGSTDNIINKSINHIHKIECIN